MATVGANGGKTVRSRRDYRQTDLFGERRFDVMSTSNADSASEIDLEAEFHSDSDAETESNAESGTASNADSDESDSTSLADRLDTVTTILRISVLAFVVAVALIPAVALWFGAVPFAPPPVGPYFAFLGLALVGTVAIIAVAIYGG